MEDPETHTPLTIEFQRMGRPDGVPAFYNHGTPGSSFEPHFIADLADEGGVALIAINRPGIGRSTYKKGMTLRNHPKIVECLADKMEIGRFAQISMSGGGPYAVAAAVHMPDRIESLTMLCSPAELAKPENLECMSKFDRLFLNLAQQKPNAANGIITMMSRFVKFLPSTIPFVIGSAMKDPDRTVYNNPDVRKTHEKSVLHAIVRGVRGFIQELRILRDPWNIDLAQIPKELPVQLLHGERDGTVHPSMSRALQSAIPHAELLTFPPDGHLMAADLRSKCRLAIAEAFRRIGKKRVLIPSGIG